MYHAVPMVGPGGFEGQSQVSMLQHHAMYERDNVGKEMLNLSENSHTPTSFKMTSPLFEGKQYNSTSAGGRGDQSVTGYSRYENNLKLLNGESSTNKI